MPVGAKPLNYLAGISQARENILAFQSRIVREKVLFRLSCREKFQHEFDSEPCSSNYRFPARTSGSMTMRSETGIRSVYPSVPRVAHV